VAGSTSDWFARNAVRGFAVCRETGFIGSGAAPWMIPSGCGRPGTSGHGGSKPGLRSRRAMRSSRGNLRKMLRANREDKPEMQPPIAASDRRRDQRCYHNIGASFYTFGNSAAAEMSPPSSSSKISVIRIRVARLQRSIRQRQPRRDQGRPTIADYAHQPRSNDRCHSCWSTMASARDAIPCVAFGVIRQGWCIVKIL
jgi:hypothetical protein